MRDLVIDQRLRDDAIGLAAAVEHGVGDDAHQPEPAAAIDEVDPAPPSSRRGRAALGEGRVATRGGAAIDREALRALLQSPPARLRSASGRAPKCGITSAAAIAPAAGSARATRPCRPRGSRRRTGRRRRSCRRPWPNGAAGTATRSPALDRERAVRAAGDDQRRHLAAKSASAASRSARPVELHDLVLVGEQQVDPPAVDHRPSSLRVRRRCKRCRTG